MLSAEDGHMTVGRRRIYRRGLHSDAFRHEKLRPGAVVADVVTP